MSDAPNLHELGTDSWAWMQPNGSWGLSNAGLIVDGDEALLVDTLFDLPRTAAMLDAMKAVSPAAGSIGTVVNTHANGDHCYGNSLVVGAQIVASRSSAEEMAEVPPKKMAMLMKATSALAALGPLRPALAGMAGLVGLQKLAWMAEAAPYAKRIFGDFDFEGIEPSPPTRTFDGRLDLAVGDRTVELHEVGPAHTRGDVIAYVPDSKLVYTGDMLFVGSHPIVWEGPVSNWIAACRRILDLDVDTVVPGHGPLTDKAGLRTLLEYLQLLETETKARHAAGMSREDCARDLFATLQPNWGERERVAVNVATIYRELDGGGPMDPIEAFAAMARLLK